VRIAIVDSNYADNVTFGLSAQWLRWELARLGVDEARLSEADFVLLTCSCPQNYKDAFKAIHGARRGAKIILGGAAAFQPSVFDGFIDVACVGEGDIWIRTLVADGYEAACVLQNSYIPGQDRTVIPDTAFTWDLPPVQSPDKITRVFASRGCKYRCLFCQTGWETSYRVNPDEDKLCTTLQAIKQRGERVSIMTNDGAEHSVISFYGHEFVSMRHDNLVKILPITKAFTKNVRLGVEGVSERLRLAVGKPIKNDELLSATYELLKNKIQVRWFFIMGLPGENDEDWLELEYLAQECRKMPWGFVFFHFHPFMPFPATPLGVLPLIDDYEPRIDNFKTMFYRGTFFTRRVQLLRHITKYKTRLAHSMANMAATEDELRRGWFDADNPNWRIRGIATPEQLRKYARIYANRVGLAQ